MEDETAARSERRDGALVSAQANEPRRSGCAFCWFVLGIYPTLTGLNEKDSLTYRLHLEKAHGLAPEIQP